MTLHQLRSKLSKTVMGSVEDRSLLDYSPNILLYSLFWVFGESISLQVEIN